MKEIDLGRDLETIVISFKSDYGLAFQETSDDIWKVLIGMAEVKAYDTIK